MKYSFSALVLALGIFTFLLFAQKKSALLPAAPTTYGDCAVFRSISLRFSRQKRRSPPASGTISCGRACLAERAHWLGEGRSLIDLALWLTTLNCFSELSKKFKEVFT
jgi:hypothetical protein